MNVIMKRMMIQSKSRSAAVVIKNFSTNSSSALLQDLIVTRAAADRLAKLSKDKATPLRLRVAVDGGGCSGFQYTYDLEDASLPLADDDKVFTSSSSAIKENDSPKVVVDSMSLDLIKGSTVDFVTEMIRSSFAVINNPLAENGCGCGSSFALKD